MLLADKAKPASISQIRHSTSGLLLPHLFYLPGIPAPQDATDFG
ncbi:hypothetical protein [Coleofasciculus sp. F4-SAH-05]